VNYLQRVAASAARTTQAAQPPAQLPPFQPPGVESPPQAESIDAAPLQDDRFVVAPRGLRAAASTAPARELSSAFGPTVSAEPAAPGEAALRRQAAKLDQAAKPGEASKPSEAAQPGEAGITATLHARFAGEAASAPPRAHGPVPRHVQPWPSRPAAESFERPAPSNAPHASPQAGEPARTTTPGDPEPRAPLPLPIPPAVARRVQDRPALSIGRVEISVENEARAPVYAERRAARPAPHAGTPALDRFRLRA
jgi:hypothetical protein